MKLIRSEAHGIENDNLSGSQCHIGGEQDNGFTCGLNYYHTHLNSNIPNPDVSCHNMKGSQVFRVSSCQVAGVKQEKVYPGEYPDQYEARDSIGRFINYYSYRRPHQSLGYVTPYGMLVGRAEEVIQKRKKQHTAAQCRRKQINKQMAEYQH
jgi:hypothetical protein